jgi:mannose-6-phosphate isomerase-like protein (cupin superfamily)
MPDEFPIHDLWIRPIRLDTSQAASVWHVLDFEDHILGRFGSLQIVRLPSGMETPFRVHDRSDEVWALVEGRARCAWQDLRPDSPTRDQIHRADFTQPTAMLAPFGVAFGVQAVDGPVLLVRLMTESEAQADEARTLDWPAGT